MYCLQWLIPVLLIPKPVNPALLYNHAVLMVLYLTGFFLERKPCTICSVVFAVALALVWSSSGYTLNCVLFGEDCSAEEMDSAVAIYSNCCDKYHDKDVCDAMRINERALATYSVSSATPVDRAGWLWKRGEMNRSFQRRWFVLRGNLLFYFEKKSERSDPAGVIVLEGCTVELAEEEQEKPYAFKIAFHGEGKRTYIAATESQEDLEEWMKIVACASFDYMKLMVVELQQQLAELEEAERAAAAAAATATAAASAVADEADAEPKPPPRQRANPFNNQTKSPVKRQTWISLHTDTGAKIRSDRVAWQSEKKASSS